jgi:hypothetical protein
VLLNVPPPDVMDHAAVDALPPMPAPLKVMADGDAAWQALKVLPGVTVAAGLTVTVTVLVNWYPAQLGGVAYTLKVVVAVKLPVGKLIIVPVPVTGLPILLLEASLSWKLTPLSEAATVIFVPVPAQTGVAAAATVLVKDAGFVATVTVKEQVAVLPEASVAE